MSREEIHTPNITIYDDFDPYTKIQGWTLVQRDGSSFLFRMEAYHIVSKRSGYLHANITIYPGKAAKPDYIDFHAKGGYYSSDVNIKDFEEI